MVIEYEKVKREKGEQKNQREVQIPFLCSGRAIIAIMAITVNPTALCDFIQSHFSILTA